VGDDLLAHFVKEQRQHIVAWPLQDIRLLRGCCARINHPFTPPSRPPALPHPGAILCTIIGPYTTLLPTSRLYTIHHTILVITISCRGQVVARVPVEVVAQLQHESICGCLAPMSVYLWVFGFYTSLFVGGDLLARLVKEQRHRVVARVLYWSR